MGAAQFQTLASGKDATDAFRRAVEDAKHEHGHGGYTGTIAEKRSHRMVATTIAKDDPEPLKAARRLAAECMDDPTHFSDDKWGPAACIDAGPSPEIPGERLFLFFGTAPS